MAIDLENMSRDELLSLKQDVEKAILTLDDRRRAAARKAAESAAREHGFSLDEVLTAQKKSGKKNPPKYRNPADPTQTWSGRGRQPGWIKSALKDGRSLSELEV